MKNVYYWSLCSWWTYFTFKEPFHSILPVALKRKHLLGGSKQEYLKYWNAALRFGRESNASVCSYVVWEPRGSADPSTSSFFFLVWPMKTQGCMEMNTFSPYSPNLRALLLDFIPNSHCQWSKSQRSVATSIIYIKYMLQYFFARRHQTMWLKLPSFLSVLGLLFISNISRAAANSHKKAQVPFPSVNYLIAVIKPNFRRMNQSLFYFLYIF